MIDEYVFMQKVDQAIKSTSIRYAEPSNYKLDVTVVAKQCWQESGLETKKAIVDDIVVKTIVHFTLWCSHINLEGLALLKEAWFHFDNNQQANTVREM
jgi:hypothetical protein